MRSVKTLISLVFLVFMVFIRPVRCSQEICIRIKRVMLNSTTNTNSLLMFVVDVVETRLLI